MKFTIEIDDTLYERCRNAAASILEHAASYAEHNESNIFPDWENLNDDGVCFEIIDGCVPIFTPEIKGLWYLHEYQLEAAYSNAGIGNNPLEKDGALAIYCFIEQEVSDWYQSQVSGKLIEEADSIKESIIDHL